MKLKINDLYFISDLNFEDKSALVEHLQEKQIYDQTLNIPYPYTEDDANEWISHVGRQREQWGRTLNWAIRDQKENLIGGIGFHISDANNSHRAELGYWLAKSHWNQGIATQAVKMATQFGLRDMQLARITAHVFHFNKASARVLEKAGYQLEGRLRNHYRKDGQIFDALLYATTGRDLLN